MTTLNPQDPRPFCPCCQKQVSPQVVASTKKVGPTILLDVPGPADHIVHNMQSITTMYCSVCGGEVEPVAFCPTCKAHAPARIEHHRYSGWTWEQAAMGFCTVCGTQVSGPEKSACFIATAAFWSPLASEVVILSEFRDTVLLRGPAGRAFVATYYRVSPPIAAWVKRFSWLAVVVRIVLRPLIMCVRRSLMPHRLSNR